MSPDVLAEMNEHVREQLIDLLAPEQVAEIAPELDTDDAVAIIEDMEADEQQAVLQAMETEDRAAIEDDLSFPEAHDRRLMPREFVAVPNTVPVRAGDGQLGKETDT